MDDSTCVKKKFVIAKKKNLFFPLKSLLKMGFLNLNLNFKFLIFNKILGLSCLDLHCAIYSTFVFLFLE
jgi:hypothetical protein